MKLNKNKKREELNKVMLRRRKQELRHKIAEDRKTKYLANLNKFFTISAIADVEAAYTEVVD